MLKEANDSKKSRYCLWYKQKAEDEAEVGGSPPGSLRKVWVNRKQSIQAAQWGGGTLGIPEGPGLPWERLSWRDPLVGSPGETRSWGFPGLDERAPKPHSLRPGLDPGRPVSEGTWDQQRGHGIGPRGSHQLLLRGGLWLHARKWGVPPSLAIATILCPRAQCSWGPALGRPGLPG